MSDESEKERVREAINKLREQFSRSYQIQDGEFVRADSTVSCIYYATGRCCHDLHFNGVNLGHGAPNGALCGVTFFKSTVDKSEVNCKECLEMIHS